MSVLQLVCTTSGGLDATSGRVADSYPGYLESRTVAMTATVGAAFWHTGTPVVGYGSILPA
jgi:hypothetical protein